MWTAKVISILKATGKITVRIAYVNGAETFEEEYTSTSKADLAWLKNQVRTRIEGFKDAYEFADTLSKDQLIDLTPPSAPTQAEIDQQAWLQDFGRLQRAQKLIDLGIIVASNPKFVALKNKVTDGLKAAYIDIL